MHIFITGVAGFLGSNLAEYYLSKGYKVSGNDNLVGGDLQNVSEKVNFYQYDCENLEKNSKYFKNVDVVVHAAAYAHEGLSVFSPYLITKNIFSGSISVFTAAIQQNVKRVVFCSSMARYGNIEQPFKESDIPNPVDPYGIAKLSAEKVLINLSKTHGIEYNIAIPHAVSKAVKKVSFGFCRTVSLEWDKNDDKVKFILILAIPDSNQKEDNLHIDLMSQIASLALEEKVRKSWEEAKSVEEISKTFQ